MKDINEFRDKIDELDKKIVSLFTERMDVAKEVASFKFANNKPVFDPERERELLNKIEKNAGDLYGNYARKLYGTVMELSRTYQHTLINNSTQLSSKALDAFKKTPDLYPEKALIACQGVEGAYSQKACDKIFKKPDIKYHKTFEDVFIAVENGDAEYGVVPLENSTAGSVNQTYSLMTKYNFSIVASTKIRVAHCLLSKNGTKLEDVKEIYSHQQAINQCSKFLEKLGSSVKVIACENTAVASKMVSESSRNDIAALSSEDCASLYNLTILAQGVQNTDNNYTRFICFSKNIEIYPGADKTSLLIRLPHRSGSLYQIISIFNALNLNLLKLESRAIPGSDFEFMFYFDVNVSVYSEDFKTMLDILENTLTLDNIKYLGSYREI